MYNEDSMTYEETLKGIIDKDSITALVGLIEQHKNWGGGGNSRVPTSVIVLLVDAIKQLKEGTYAGK